MEAKIASASCEIVMDLQFKGAVVVKGWELKVRVLLCANFRYIKAEVGPSFLNQNFVSMF